ncbi:hypothetical protein JZO77_17350 [Enterococcus hulanensis]|uniref:hypothetical protein n=1 Tax=Enterococcus hulanensis TaxID=2559929 RepID=UPI001A8DE201|nr:hypothetical protein [Enterococcus hulanensis]MBO0458503.1 hypothetical protein [Enterococcus hulanensis]MDT2662975.1 hypothetical protein [Enterococcus hulanensis]
MNFDHLIWIFDLLEKVQIRKYVFVLMVVMMTVSYLKVRHDRRKITQEEEDAAIEATYQKDENGLYPWEADTNDHPSRVKKNSQPLKRDWGPQRGKW